MPSQCCWSIEPCQRRAFVACPRKEIPNLRKKIYIFSLPLECSERERDRWENSEVGEAISDFEKKSLKKKRERDKKGPSESHQILLLSSSFLSSFLSPWMDGGNFHHLTVIFFALWHSDRRKCEQKYSQCLMEVDSGNL